MTCITADANVFNTRSKFDRIISIEMFEVSVVICFLCPPPGFKKAALSGHFDYTVIALIYSTPLVDRLPTFKWDVYIQTIIHSWLEATASQAPFPSLYNNFQVFAWFY